MCKHVDTSIVYMDTKEFGPFVTVQCDLCGAVLPGAEVPDATLFAWLDGKLKLPRMDFGAYCRAVDVAWAEVLDDGTRKLGTFLQIVNSKAPRR